MKMTLQHLQKNRHKTARFAGKFVYIWSGQWHAWWGPNRSGYTTRMDEAGVYTFEDAWACSSHCGPEKKIVYETIPLDYSI